MDIKNASFPFFFIKSICLLSFSLFWNITNLFAEGTKQLTNSSLDRVYLYANMTEYNDFGRYDGRDDQRLYFHIANPNSEQVYLGFSQPVSSGHHPCNGSSLITGYFRIKDPNGRIVFPVLNDPNGQILDGTTSNITSYAQVEAGPQPIAGASGYQPFIFDPAGMPAGDYYVEFSRLSNTPTLNIPMPIEWWDITVATKSNPTAIDGRVFSRNWALFAPSISCGIDETYTWFDRPFNGKFYVYTNENIVAQVDFNNAGFQPAAFNIVFNDSGTENLGNVISDRKSRNDIRSSASKHRIFLNDPDINVYPTGKLGQFELQPLYIICANGSSCVEVALSEPGQIDILIDLDTTSGKLLYDPETADVLISYKVVPLPGETKPYVRCIPWNGKDGLGNVVENSEEANLLTRYTQGIYHFPIYDAEYMLGGFEVRTIRPIPNNGSPGRLYYDDREIPDSYGNGIDAPRLNAFNECKTPCHIWSNSEFGNRNTINTWFFAREEYGIQLEKSDCPIDAINDSAMTIINVPQTITILNNDVGANKMDTMTMNIGINPPNGTVSLNPSNLIANYTPNPGFIGRDSFTYTFCYNIIPTYNLCDSATVLVLVQPTDEDCENTFDDDGDGLTDCDDPDCQITAPTIQRKKGEKD